jgi:hypothetical protein
MYRPLQILLPGFLLLLAYGLPAQDAEIFPPDSIKKDILAVEIFSSLTIDGSLNEIEWSLATPAPDFIQVEPLQGEAASFKTQVRVLYNRKYVYFGIFSHDSLGKKAIRAIDFKRDFDIRQHDQIGLAFDGFNDQRNAMAFTVNPYGVQRDLLTFDDSYYDVDWDGLWRVRTSRSDSGWVAEIAIPWQTLRYPKSADTIQNWGFNLYRNRRLSNEITAFSPFPRAFTAQRMDYAGLLKNLKPPPPKANVRIQPYVLGSYDRFKGYSADVKPESTKVKVGGDVKWAINPNAVLDLTANTDFAQADADRQVNNVTRFSVFFPERRQFFLENASLFGVGVGPAIDGSGGSMRIQPFFSRTIGLDGAGNPIPIDAGGRFVYRSSKRNFGAMAIRQREVGDSPATNFFVGRFSENLGAQNRIGGLVTVKNHPGGTNVVSTLDGFFRLGATHSLTAMAMHSSSQYLGKNGFAGIAQYYNSTNNYKIWWTESVVTKDFNPEMGFVARTDVLGTTPGMNWYYRGRFLPFKKVIRAFEPGFLPEFYHSVSTGKLIERQLTLFPVWINFQNGGWFGYSVNPVFQRLTEPFEPLGVTIGEGDYHYFRQQLWYTTDPSKVVNLLGQTDWGTYFNGRLFSTDLTLQVAPLPHISIAGRFNRNRFKEVGEDRITKNVDLYSIEGRFALNPRLQLIGFYQKNSENKSDNYNIRVAWEYRPLSYVYLVLNKRGFEGLDRIRRNEDHAVLKVSYLRQL